MRMVIFYTWAAIIFQRDCKTFFPNILFRLSAPVFLHILSGSEVEGPPMITDPFEPFLHFLITFWIAGMSEVIPLTSKTSCSELKERLRYLSTGNITGAYSCFSRTPATVRGPAPITSRVVSLDPFPDASASPLQRFTRLEVSPVG